MNIIHILLLAIFLVYAFAILKIVLRQPKAKNKYKNDIYSPSERRAIEFEKMFNDYFKKNE